MQDWFIILQESCKLNSNLARILQDGFKSCKNLARCLQEVCIPLQDCLQDSCKIINSSITRVGKNCNFTGKNRSSYRQIIVVPFVVIRCKVFITSSTTSSGKNSKLYNVSRQFVTLMEICGSFPFVPPPQLSGHILQLFAPPPPQRTCHIFT